MVELLSNFWFLVFAWLSITSVAATVAQAWQKIRRAEADAALKQEMLQRGLSVEEMERVLNPSEAPLSEEAAYRELGACLADKDFEGPVVEEVMAAFRAADLPAKRALVQMFKGIADNGGELTEAWLLAIVRGLRSFPDAPPALPTSQQFAARSMP